MRLYGFFIQALFSFYRERGMIRKNTAFMPDSGMLLRVRPVTK